MVVNILSMVTVIFNTVNEDSATLIKAIKSYIDQDCQLIISTVEGDKCLDYVKATFPSVEIAILPLKDHPGKSPQGSFIQLNNALKLMKGDWFCFASGNDYADPNKLKDEVYYCITNNREVCYSSFYKVFPDGKRSLVPLRPYDYNLHLKGNFVSDCALMSKRLVDKYLPFRTELNNYAYWDLWLRIYEGEGNTFVHNPSPTWHYVQRDSDMHIQRQKSTEQILQARKDRDRMLKLHVK